MVLFYVPVGPLSFRRARSLDAKDRSSFRLQSITCASRHVSAKNATRSVRIHQDLSSTPENSKVVYIGVSLEFSPVLRGQIQQPQSPQRALRQNDAKPGKREKSCLMGAGGYGKCTGEDFFNQLSGNGWADCCGSGISPHPRKKPESDDRNTFRAGVYHSVVLRA